MGAEIITNFDVKTGLPIDSRMVKTDIAARNAIPAVERYRGLMVYVLSENATYQLQGGITDLHWAPSNLGESIPTFDGIQFNINPDPQTPAEGLLRWNTADGTLDLGMKGGDITLQVGQESFVKVKNESGVSIGNGKPVYFDGAAADGRPTIRLLSNGPHDDCLAAAGITTEVIAAGAEGFVTVWGKVRNIDTSTLIEDALVYVGHDAGELTSNKPDPEHHTVVVGICTKSDLTEGELFVKRPIIMEPKELQETTGFHKDFISTVSWNRAQRTFSITPDNPVQGFSFYQGGLQYIKYTTESIQIPDVEGIHYIFYNLGVLSTANNLTKEQVIEAIENYAIVAQIYWDADNNEELILGEERHGFIMDGETHSYLHMVFGPQWIDGMAISSLNVAGSGAADSHAQFAVDAGLHLDEDLDLFTSGVASTEGLPIFCYDGAEKLRRYSQPGFSVLTDVAAGIGITGRLVYNKFAVGLWSLEVVPDDDFVLCHVFATNDPNQPYIAFVGRTTYTDLASAQAGAESEISPIINNSLKQEFTPVATIAFQTNDLYANAVKAKAVPSIAGGTYSDWRVSRSSAAAPGGGGGDHNDLGGKQGGIGPGEFYHLSNAAYTRSNQAATAVLNGYLSAVDWAVFNGKANAIHNLVDTVNHPVAGLTPGHFMKATGAATYAFTAHGLVAADVGAEPANANIQAHISDVLTNPHAVSYAQLGPIGWAEFSTNTKNPAHNAWIGASNTSAASVVTSDGVDVKLTVQPASGPGNLTLIFSTGFVDVDCDPPLEVILNAGTDISPILNYVYILKSAPTVLTVSIVGFPAAEHHPIGTFIVQSAASVQAYGCYKVHLWTDHIWKNTTQNGHIAHINQWIRTQPATWLSGVDLTATVTAGVKDIVTIATTSGSVMQLHPHSFPAFDSAGVANTNLTTFFAPNHQTPYTSGKDLATAAFLQTEAGVSAVAGDFLIYTVWGSVPEYDGDTKMFVNLPSGVYRTVSEAETDPANFAVEDIPVQYIGTGFLIAHIIIQVISTTLGNYQVALTNTFDLRGSFPVKSTHGTSFTGYAPLSFKTTLDAINGLVKCNGAGVYSAVVDNSATWNALVTFPGFAADGVATAGKAVEATDLRLSNARTPTSHTHGNITNAGHLGVLANIPLITGAAGIIQAGSFGTAANTFCQGNDSRLGTGRATIHNASIAAQSTFAADQYLTGSSILIPTASLQVRTLYKCSFEMTKTAAGTAASVINVRFGTNGTTADTSRLTFTLTAGSAQIDTAWFDLEVVFRNVGAGTSVITGVLSAHKNNTGATQGVFGQFTQVLKVTSAAFDSTIAGSYIGLSYNGGLNFVGTSDLVEASLENLI